MVGDYQTLEQAKARAAEKARQKELDEIERRKQEELASAKSHEELDAIQERSNQEAAAVPPVTPVKAPGQVVKQDWSINITDIWTLARAHPACVDLKPRLSEIRQLLDAGVKVAGVDASKVTKVGVRVGRQQKAIEV